jgi:hypothetical protein
MIVMTRRTYFFDKKLLSKDYLVPWNDVDMGDLMMDCVYDFDDWLTDCSKLSFKC